MRRIILSIVVFLGIVRLFAEGTQPNILFILTDDMGYSDVGFNQVENSPVNDIVTPNLDKLAEEGTIFSSAYAAHMFCGPSRAALMTGRYAHKLGSQFNLAAFSEDGIDQNETYISEVLHDAGYYTSIIGKWHLGEEDKYHPNSRGYDHFYGFLGGGHYYFSDDWHSVAKSEESMESSPEGAFANEYLIALKRNKEFVEKPSENLYLTDMLTTEGVNVMDSAKNKKQPFFLFMSYNAPHTILQAKDSDIAALKAEPYNITFADEHREKYSAMMYALDKQIKVLIDALKANGQYDNTLIVFMSDNGGKIVNDAGANNHPLKGGKGDVDEGGIRVPMFMHWPAGMADAPATFNHVVSALDLFPTFANIAKATVPEDKQLDGKDIFNNVMTNTDARPEEAIFALNVKSPNNWVIARQGKWKAKTFGDGNWSLFNLDADIGETSNVVNSEELKALKEQAHQWALTHKDPLWFDAPKYNFETKWIDGNMPNWERTFPEDVTGDTIVSKGEVLVTALNWTDGSNNNRGDVTKGSSLGINITYASDKDSAAYVVFYSRQNDAYPTVTDVARVALPATPYLKTINVDILIPASLIENSTCRVHMGRAGLGSYLWTNTQRYATTPVALYFTTKAQSGSGGSTLAVNKLTWEGGGRTGMSLKESSDAKVLITYEGALANDSIYLIVTYKEGGSYTGSATQVKFGFPEESGEVLVPFPVQAFNSADADANIVRLHLGLEQTSGWSGKIDVAADGSVGNDAIYGTVIKSTTPLNHISVSKLNVYPNPSKGEFNFKLENTAQITVCGLSGISLLSQRGNAGLNTVKIYKPGTYILIVKDKLGIKNTLLQVK